MSSFLGKGVNMALRQFVTEGELKKLTTISANVDSVLLAPFFSESDEENILPLLGEELFAAILDDIEAEALVGDRATLVEKLKPAAAWWTYYEALPDLRAKATNKGLVLKKSEDSEPMSAKSFNDYRDVVKGRAVRKTERFRKWLCDNEGLFPELDEDNDTTDGSSYFSGIVFG